MHPDDGDLATPWLRAQLLGHLRNLADPQWLENSLQEASGKSLDEIMDFFDDSGLLDDPSARIGFIIYDVQEAGWMAELAVSVDKAVGAGVPMDRRAWRAVGSASRAALRRLEARRGK